MKCLVYGCKNHSNQGRFLGNICFPCYEMLRTGQLSRGQTFIHRLAEAKHTIYANHITIAADLKIAEEIT